MNRTIEYYQRNIQCVKKMFVTNQVSKFEIFNVLGVNSIGSGISRYVVLRLTPVMLTCSACFTHAAINVFTVIIKMVC